MKDETKTLTPPYTTYASFVNLINDLRESGIPAQISRSVVKGSNSGKATMSASLKSLGLTSADMKPTPILTALVNDQEDYKDNLRKMVNAAYPFILDGSINLANATSEMVAQKFKEAGANGSTVSKSVGLFLSLAREAGIEVSSRVKAPAPDRATARPKVKKAAPTDESSEDEGDDNFEGEVPEGMIKIPIPLHGMDDGAIFLPEGMNKKQWDYAKKMAAFILDNYHTDFGDEP